MAADKGFSLPTAQQAMEKLALAEAEKASAAAPKQAELESLKKMLLEKITKPSGVSDEEALRRVAAIISERSRTASPRCMSIAFRTRSAAIMAAPSTSRSRVGRRR